MHESNFYVIGFSYGSNTCDAVGRVSRTWAAFVVAATVAFSCILAATSSSWILAAIASSWPSRPEFQHSYPTFGLGMPAATVGTSSWRASPAVGNASVDDTDITAIVTFFFTTNGKTFVPTFNCYLHNTSQCQIICLLIHLSSSDLFHWLDAPSSMQFSTWEDPVRVMAVASAAMQRRDELYYVMYLCRKTTTMYCCEDYMDCH
jgi:hypothetical protein